MLARTYAQSIRAAWVHNTRPVRDEVPDVSLGMFRENVALDPAELRKVPEPLGRSVPNEELEQRGQNEEPAHAHHDYWVETENTWTCVHVLPRSTLFSPYDLKDGPDPSTLGPVRTTQMIPHRGDGSKEKVDAKIKRHN